jgi:alcohol dehydrogenase (cytochrome c)
MRKALIGIGGALVGVGIVGAVLVYAYWNKAVPIAAMGINYVRYLSAPAGTIKTEQAAAVSGSRSPSASATLPTPQLSSSQPGAGENDWPSYNKTLKSDRYSQLSQINRKNVSKLKILCTYDTGRYTGFTSGLLEVDNALIFSTEYDIFSIDPSNCHQNWHTHEDYTPATPQGVNRGPAYLDGKLFRGTQDRGS